MSEHDPGDLLSIDQVAQRLNVGRTFAWELTASGRLPTVRLGRLVKVRTGRPGLIPRRPHGRRRREAAMTVLAPPPRVAYSVDEAAAAMGLSAKHLRRLVATGELRSVRSGRRVLVRPADLVDYLAALDREPMR